MVPIISTQIIVALLCVNVLTFVTFWVDKRRAQAGLSRIPERTLLGLSVIGGTPAAFLAQRLLRHKTQKEPFRSRLRLITTVQIVATIWYCISALS